MSKLSLWLKTEHGRGLRLARHLGVPPSFVSKMASGEKPVPIEHGAAIEQFTAGQVSRRDLFPNTWQRIWPEAVAPTPTPTAPAAQGAEQAAGVANA